MNEYLVSNTLRDLTGPGRVLAVYVDETLTHRELRPVIRSSIITIFPLKSATLSKKETFKSIFLPQKFGSWSSTNTPRGSGYCIWK